MRMRTIWSVLIAAVLVPVMAGCSSSSKPPTVSLATSLASITQGASVTLSGAVTKHEAGIIVTLQSLAGSTYKATGQQATTDASGAYQFTYTPLSPGKTSLRVEIANGKKPVDSTPVSVTALSPVDLKLSVSGPKEVDVAKTVKIVGTIDPAVPGAVVTIQSSSAGTAFTATAASVSLVGRTFTATVPAPGGATGSVQLRASIAATASSATTTSPSVSVYFADYRADGAAYLACVKTDNALNDALSATITKYNNGSATLTKLKAAMAAVSKGDKDEASCFAARTWPPSVAGLVADLGTSLDVTSDIENQAAKTSNISDFNARFDSTFDSAAHRGSSDAATIRARLGLPART